MCVRARADTSTYIATRYKGGTTSYKDGTTWYNMVPVPAQMWQRLAQSRRRCGESRRRCGHVARHGTGIRSRHRANRSRRAHPSATTPARSPATHRAASRPNPRMHPHAHARTHMHTHARTHARARTHAQAKALAGTCRTAPSGGNDVAVLTERGVLKNFSGVMYTGRPCGVRRPPQCPHRRSSRS